MAVPFSNFPVCPFEIIFLLFQRKETLLSPCITTLQKSFLILLKKISGDTICGITRNIGRDGEEKRILTLDELLETQVDMFTTVFIGNSQTRKVGDAMVTPRGYRRDNA